MAAYRQVHGLKIICRLTACTTGSAPGTMLGNKCGEFYSLIDAPFMQAY